jgi:hypothetical protein
LLALLGLCLAAGCNPRPSLSFELGDFPKGTKPTAAVSIWLGKNRAIIISEARRRKVTPVAIAGVIAYEALEDPEPSLVANLVRFSGPGKVHFREYRFLEGMPLAKQIELLGYLPPRTMQQRKDILSTTNGAVAYIAAIFRAFSDLTVRYGDPVDCNPADLATLYTAWDLPTLLRRVERDPRPLRLNDAGTWVATHDAYLRAALAFRARC